MFLVTISNYALIKTGNGYDLTVIDTENKWNKVKAWSLLDFQPLISGKKNVNTMLKELKEINWSDSNLKFMSRKYKKIILFFLM